MLLEIASEKTLGTSSPARNPAGAAALHPLAKAGPPKILAALKQAECRFCISDTAPGQMHLALFCAAPVEDGPYCAAHRRACSLPSDCDLDALVAEIQAAIATPP